MEQQAEAELGRGIASVLQRQGRKSIPAPTPPRLQVILMLSLQWGRMCYACWRCDISAQRQAGQPSAKQASSNLDTCEVQRRAKCAALICVASQFCYRCSGQARHCRRHSDSFFLTKILKQVNIDCTVYVFRLQISWAATLLQTASEQLSSSADADQAHSATYCMS